MGKKEDKVQRLMDRGMTDPREIAKKLGYSGSRMAKGIEYAKEAMEKINDISTKERE